MHKSLNIHLVTNTTGFPNGTAAAKRITMIGKALVASGCDFFVYTGTLKDNRYNKNQSGVVNGIQYQYLHGTTKLKIGPAQKLVLYLKGVVALNKAIKKMHPLKDIVYIYSQGNIYNIITLLLCRRYGIHTVEEINEWDYEEMKGMMRKYIFRGPMVQWADGAVVISKNIEENVLQINPNLKTLIIPVLDDPEIYDSAPGTKTNNKYCFWMGLVDGYIDDVLLIVESCGLAFQNGCDIDLVISGPCKHSLDIIKKKALSVNFPEDKVKMIGYVSDDALNQLCRNAFFYVVPLWHNQKSLNRFPTKIAPFMFCGKPLLTCNIGEVGHLLSDRENAIFYEAGDANDLAIKIGLIYNDTVLYNKLCSNAKQFALETFSYHKYSEPLHYFFKELINGKKSVYGRKRLASHA